MSQAATGKKKEIYTYQSPWTAYTISWCGREDAVNKFKIAIGSYKEEYSNSLTIIQLKNNDNHTGDDTDRSFVKICEAEHPYPATKIMWAPSTLDPTLGTGQAGSSPQQDLIATTGDYLRLWSVSEDKCEMKTVFHNNKHTEYCSPLTSFDWNVSEPTIIGTCSIDTTCTIWDINAKEPKTQLIAHDKEVYDIAFASGTHIFGTVGGDGSLRMFDLRSLEHSTILYESPERAPLLRLAWNKQDPNYLATIETNNNKAIIMDIRVPSIPIAELSGHHAAINGIAWAPHSAFHICTCSDDRQALIWDMTTGTKLIEDPILAYDAGEEINHVQWSSSHQDWVGISFADKVQILRV
jgi:DDB1- and CUL4-associated factor 7